MLGTVVEIDTSSLLSVTDCSSCGQDELQTYSTVTMSDKGVEHGTIGLCLNCLSD